MPCERPKRKYQNNEMTPDKQSHMACDRPKKERYETEIPFFQKSCSSVNVSTFK